eukprot:scaffold474_cov169-Ochromonas_danica.AAC.35
MVESVQWKRSRYHSLGSPDQLDAMEAHSMTSLFDRYLVIIAGWGQSEVGQVYIIDGIALPEALILIHVREIHNRPRFRYGFTTIAYKNDLIVYGGCQIGGYAGDCNVRDGTGEEVHFNQSHSLDLIRHASLGYFSAAVATYSPNLSSLSSMGTLTSYQPLSRGYHSAVSIILNRRDVMLVWGGLHNRAPCQNLELFDLENRYWFKGESEGEEPCSRFGHSSVALNDKIIFTGGSDGNDLLRNGRELRDVYVLHIVRDEERGDRLVWSQVLIRSFAHRMQLLPGRCHTACRLDDEKILFFGGSATNSSRLTLLDLQGQNYNSNNNNINNGDSSRSSDSAESMISSCTSNEPLQIRAHVRALTSLNPEEPIRRVSSTAALVGPRFMVIFGGWNNNYRELGDVWTLDICANEREIHSRLIYAAYPMLKDSAAFMQQAPPTDSEEESEEEEEEETSDESGNYQGQQRGEVLQMILQNLTEQGLAAQGFATFVQSFIQHGGDGGGNQTETPSDEEEEEEHEETT